MAKSASCNCYVYLLCAQIDTMRPRSPTQFTHYCTCRIPRAKNGHWLWLPCCCCRKFLSPLCSGCCIIIANYDDEYLLVAVKGMVVCCVYRFGFVSTADFLIKRSSFVRTTNKKVQQTRTHTPHKALSLVALQSASNIIILRKNY